MATASTASRPAVCSPHTSAHRLPGCDEAEEGCVHLTLAAPQEAAPGSPSSVCLRAELQGDVLGLQMQAATPRALTRGLGSCQPALP